jgi:lysophospholipase L1-like esterase
MIALSLEIIMNFQRFCPRFSGGISFFARAAVVWTVLYILFSLSATVPGTEAASPAPGDSDTAVRADPPPPTQAPEIPEKPVSFEKSVFLGNSSIESLYVYGLALDADFFYRVGLTVSSVFTKPTVSGTVPVVDEVNGRRYDEVFLMFGQNELGWEYTDIFIDRYAGVIDAVRERQPDARIYIMSIPPVSERVSAKNVNGVNQEKVVEYNARLAELARVKGADYLNVAPMLMDERGFLPEDASSDGIHLNKAYSEIWMRAILAQVEAAKSPVG